MHAQMKSLKKKFKYAWLLIGKKYKMNVMY